MSDHNVLNTVLDGTQVPYQPFVVIVDSAVFSGLPLFRESLRRALNRGGPVLLVTALHDPDDILPNYSSYPKAHSLDLTTSIPGFSGSSADVEGQVLAAYEKSGPGTQVFIDDISTVAQDYGAFAALKLVKALLRTFKTAKPPSRLTILCPHTASILPSLIPPTLSPSLTLLHTYHPNLITHLSQAYLLAVEPSPSAQFWMVIERARDRRMQEKLAFGGSEGIDVVGEWAHTSVTVPTAKPGAVVGVTVRKPSGGVKGISRYLNAVVAEPTTKGSSGLVVVPLNQLISVNPILTPRDNKTIGEKPPQTHVDLDLPFNLSLTDEQKRRRGEVPLPYAHEGEGVGIEFGDSEDEDDEEI